MRGQTEDNSVRTKALKGKAEGHTKKAYHFPRLVVYGSLQKLTTGGMLGGLEVANQAGAHTML